MSASAILAENARRTARLLAPYDPLTGAGSLEARVPVGVLGGSAVRVPAPMMEQPAVQALARAGSIEALADRTGHDVAALLEDFTRLRFRYDYEYWCATCVRIEIKEIEEGDVGAENDVTKPLVLNLPQRLSLHDREKQRLAGQPVRQIEVKHRQYGSTTEKAAYLAWHQNVLLRGFNTYIVSLEKGGAAVLTRKYDVLARHYPPAVGTITFKGVQNAPSTMLVEERGGRISVASVTNPQAPSGDTAHGVLISEAGKMRSGTVQDAGRLMTNLMSLVPMRAGTCVLVESTAEASGQWFKRQVEKAQASAVPGAKRSTNLALTFTSWTSDARCTMPLSEARQGGVIPAPEDWIAAWSEEERAQWDAGATLEGMAWYAAKAADYDDPSEMKQENPTTVEEAFQTSSNRIFAPRLVALARKSVRAPLMRGRLVADGFTGAGAFSGLRFERSAGGPVSVWRLPGDTLGGVLEIPSGANLKHRYCAASDVGPGMSKSADFSHTVVLDRAWRLFGGHAEVAATWHGHEDPDLYAWQAAQLAYWYERALWAIEVNSMPRLSRDEQSPDFGLTALDEIMIDYPNLYMREAGWDDLMNRPVTRAGWHTSRTTKQLLVTALKKALRGLMPDAPDQAPAYTEREHEACAEMDVFVAVGRTMGAEQGRKDDRVVARGIALHLDQTMPAPEIVLPRKPRKRRPRPDVAI